MNTLSSLKRVFLADHRVLTRGLYAIVDSVRANAWSKARRQADALDEAVGSHMAFEEEVYYPRLRMVLGDEFVDRLYGEHAEGLEAIRTLLSGPDDAPLGPAECARVIDQLETAFEHAKSCGTLLSHLAVLPGDEQAELLRQLETRRRVGGRWTRLSRVRTGDHSPKVRSPPA